MPTTENANWQEPAHLRTERVYRPERLWVPPREGGTPEKPGPASPRQAGPSKDCAELSHPPRGVKVCPPLFLSGDSAPFTVRRCSGGPWRPGPGRVRARPADLPASG